VVDKVYRIADRTTKDLPLNVGEKLVTRLWSWDDDRLKKDAEDEQAIAAAEGITLPYYSVSAFAMPLEPAEEVDDLINRLIGARAVV
jgi:hypothetical protein